MTDSTGRASLKVSATLAGMTFSSTKMINFFPGVVKTSSVACLPLRKRAEEPAAADSDFNASRRSMAGNGTTVGPF